MFLSTLILDMFIIININHDNSNVRYIILRWVFVVGGGFTSRVVQVQVRQSSSCLCQVAGRLLVWNDEKLLPVTFSIDSCPGSGVPHGLVWGWTLWPEYRGAPTFWLGELFFWWYSLSHVCLNWQDPNAENSRVAGWSCSLPNSHSKFPLGTKQDSRAHKRTKQATLKGSPSCQGSRIRLGNNRSTGFAFEVAEHTLFSQYGHKNNENKRTIHGAT